MFIGKNIKFLRKNAKLTQKELSIVLGMKSNTIIGKYEENKVKPGVEVLEKIAAHFGVDLQDLMFTDLDSQGVGYVEEPRAEYGSRVVRLLEKELDRLEELEQKIKANKRIMDEIRKIDPDLAKAIEQT